MLGAVTFVVLSVNVYEHAQQFCCIHILSVLFISKESAFRDFIRLSRFSCHEQENIDNRIKSRKADSLEIKRTHRLTNSSRNIL